MSTAKSRNFRRRAGDDEEDDANGGETTSIASASAKPTTKPSSNSSSKPKPKPQAPKRLSFADDEENEIPSRSSLSSKRSVSEKSSSRLGKPSSHKITTSKDRLANSSSLPSNVQPQAGTYTKEALRELQKNTRTLASSSRSSSDSKPSSEPVIVLKGLVKPTSDTVKEVPESESEDDEDELREKNFQVPRNVHDDAQAKLASMGVSNGRNSSGSLIPDPETIKAIRAKRERLRQAGPAAADYISLDGGSNHGAAEGLSDEEPEFQGRIAMFGEKKEGVKKGVFEDVDERAIDTRLKDSGEDEDDEEEKMWEEEQFRKGLGKRMEEGYTRVSSSDVPVVQVTQQQKFAPSASTVYSTVPSRSVSSSIGGVTGVSQGMDVVPISEQAEIAKKALQENVRRLKV